MIFWFVNLYLSITAHEIQIRQLMAEQYAAFEMKLNTFLISSQKYEIWPLNILYLYSGHEGVLSEVYAQLKLAKSDRYIGDTMGAHIMSLFVILKKRRMAGILRTINSRVSEVLCPLYQRHKVESALRILPPKLSYNTDPWADSLSS